MAATGPGTSHSRLFQVTDRLSGVRFLVDTGAAISVVPVPAELKRRTPANDVLLAANGSTISTFGTRAVTLDFGIRRSFSWIFVLADVSCAILGADFLHYYHLQVDVRRRRLVDGLTDLSVHGITVQGTPPSPVVISMPASDAVASLLGDFPSVTNPSSQPQPVKHNVCHHITTTGPPRSYTFPSSTTR